MLKPTLALVPLLALLSAPLAAQVVRGRGRDMGRARTGPDGAFQLGLRAAGTVRIRAERAGYQATLTGELPVAPREAVEVEVRISSSAVAMEPLRGTARVRPPPRRNRELNGFYRGGRLGIGQYVRREDIERRANANLAQVLARVPGARIRYQGAHEYIYFPRNGEPSLVQNRRGPPRNACLPRLFVDGTRVTYDAMNDINSVVNPNQVEALEVFRGAS